MMYRQLIPNMVGLLLCAVTLVACGAQPIERAIVGKWASNASEVRFEFFDNGTFIIDDPNNPIQKHLTGKYHVLGESTTLRDAEFILQGGYNIRFTSDGDAFFVYIDNAGSPEVLYHDVTAKVLK